MKVLLTGANGFVGSRILRRLTASGIPTAVLLRPSGTLGLVQDCLPQVEVRSGSVEDSASLESALAEVTHVIHCAGRTKALRMSEFAAVNVDGTRRLVGAINRRAPPIERLVLISSLAASGPARAGVPVREDDPPRPVSAYGRSKLAGERVVRETCRVPWVTLRPGGVYGPGDRDFLQLFRSVQRGFCPQFGGGVQPLNLVYVDDLAEVSVMCLTHEGAPGGTFHVAHSTEVTAGELARAVATSLGATPRTLALPSWALVPISWIGELSARLNRKPGILSIDRRRELMAPGWVCDTGRLRTVLGLQCSTSLPDGLRETAAWYVRAGWLAGDHPVNGTGSATTGSAAERK